MIRTKDWKLVHFLNAPYGQLFDLKQDPLENHNLWNSNDHQSIKQDMLNKMFNWRMQSQLKTQNVFQDYR